MPRLTIIGGLPGSGKTPLIEEMKRANDKLYFHHDFMTSGRAEDATSSPEYPKVLEKLRADNDCAIADCLFVQLNLVLQLVESIARENANVEFHWVIYENNPEKCISNILSNPNRTEDASARVLAARKVSKGHLLPLEVRVSSPFTMSVSLLPTRESLERSERQ